MPLKFDVARHSYEEITNGKYFLLNILQKLAWRILWNIWLQNIGEISPDCYNNKYE